MKYRVVEKLFREYPNLPITKITELYIEKNPDELRQNKIDTIRRKIQFYKEYLEDIRKTEKRTRPESLVVLISDTHFGRRTWSYEDPERIDFSSEIAKERAKVLERGILRIYTILKKSYDFKGIYILFLGDIIDGELTFPVQQFHIDSPEFKQVLFATDVFGNFVDSLKNEIGKVYLRGVWGNHAHNPKMHDLNRGDMFFYEFLKKEYEKDPQVDIDFSKQFFQVVEIEKHGFLLYHGMSIRNYLGIPYYGIGKWGAKRIKTLPKEWDYLLLGHFHQLNYLNYPGFEVYMNGTFVSSDPYSLERFGVDGDNRFWLLSVHEERGITFQYKIDVRG